jgi:hypothetical protein
MTEGYTAAHFEVSIAAAANRHALTPKVIQAAQRELALYAAARSVNKMELPTAPQTFAQRASRPAYRPSYSLLAESIAHLQPQR